jgi:uncharacterized protein YkvS
MMMTVPDSGHVLEVRDGMVGTIEKRDVAG